MFGTSLNGRLEAAFLQVAGRDLSPKLREIYSIASAMTRCDGQSAPAARSTIGPTAKEASSELSLINHMLSRVFRSGLKPLWQSASLCSGVSCP